MKYYVLILIQILLLCQNVQTGLRQKRLLTSLFKNYNPLERPVENDNESLLVNVGLALQQIVDIDEKKQTIIFSGWLDLTWRDYNLQWNPEEYGNITTIRVPSNRIWVPDLLLYNSADDSFDSTSKVNAVIESGGAVSYIPPGMFKSTCVIRVDDFPFDEQICSLKFGSWTYDESAINLKNKSDRGQNDSYIKNGEWILEGIFSYSESISYDCCAEKYPFVMFEIHVRRRTLYFEFNLIFPCILISFMCLLGFTLPPDCGEKISLEVTVLLVIIMFSQTISDLIPASSLSVPRIALYFMSVMVISSMSIIANIFVLIFHHRNVRIQRPMPDWIKIFICIHLARILRMKSPYSKSEMRKSAKKSKITKNDNVNNLNEALSKGFLSCNNLESKSRDDSGVFLKSASQVSSNNKSNKAVHVGLHPANQYSNLKLKHRDYNGFTINQCPNSLHYLARENSSYSHSSYDNTCEVFTNIRTDVFSLRKSLGLILKEICLITARIKQNEECENKELCWKFAAQVIDRLCMIIFAILTFLSTAFILFTSKNFFKDSDPGL